MYLANTFAYILTQNSKSEIFKDMRENVSNIFHYGFSNMENIIQNYELYTFEKSALLAASDIRLDKPQGLERIAELVFDEPCKIFIEANYQDRKNAFEKLNLHNRESDVIDIGDPVRVGLIINVIGGGKASIRVCWITPKNTIKQHVPKEVMRDAGIDKADFKLFQNLTAMNFTAYEIVVDTNQIQDTTMKDFEELIRTGDETAVSIVEYIKKNNLQFGKPIMQRGWQLYRLNQFSSLNLHKGSLRHIFRMTQGLTPSQIDNLLDTLKEDLNGEILFAIAMLAVLKIDSLKIKKVPALDKTIHTRRASKNAPKRSIGDDVKLGIVSIDIDKALEQELYQNKAVSAEPTGRTISGRKSPVIHAVRGHLFRARNGKIVYRGPHWRGKKGHVNFIRRVR